jgi:hypothetical protein
LSAIRDLAALRIPWTVKLPTPSLRIAMVIATMLSGWRGPPVGWPGGFRWQWFWEEREFLIVTLGGTPAKPIA